MKNRGGGKKKNVKQLAQSQAQSWHIVAKKFPFFLSIPQSIGHILPPVRQPRKFMRT